MTRRYARADPDSGLATLADPAIPIPFSRESPDLGADYRNQRSTPGQFEDRDLRRRTHADGKSNRADYPLV